MYSDAPYSVFLGKGMTKADMLRLVDSVLKKPSKIDELWAFSLSSDSNAWRGMWALNLINEREPELIKNYVAELCSIIPASKNNSMLREMMKILRIQPLPEDTSGELLDFCMNIVASSAYPVGVRMCAMDVVQKFIQRYPELIPEFKIVLEDIVSEPPSVGTKFRAIKLLERFSSEK